MNIEQYIKEYHDGRSDWFVEEVKTVANQSRVNHVMDLKDYLSGQHAIKQLPSEMFNGKEFIPRKIVLNHALMLLNFQTSFLLGNDSTITGDERIVKEFQKVNKSAKYNRLNYKILSTVLKYGTVYEYLYMDKGDIKSKLIDPAESYPVYDHENNMVAFIEAYMSDGIDYYNVFTDDVVYRYDNKGGDLRLVSQFSNLSGLPIAYHNENELSSTEGRSELENWIDILNNLEYLISKATDGFLKHIVGIPVITGMQLKGDGIPTNIIGGGLVLDDGATFDFKSNKFDYQAFKTLYDTLLDDLYKVAQIPSIIMGRSDISNISTESMKILYQLCLMKAKANQMFMIEGIEQRFNVIRKLLEYRGITFSEDEFNSLGIVFNYDLPSSDKETIDNLKELKEIGAISLESILSHSPYTSDVQMELERINSEGSNVDRTNEGE